MYLGGADRADYDLNNVTHATCLSLRDPSKSDKRLNMVTHLRMFDPHVVITRRDLKDATQKV